jgi:hypothetical protein
MCRFFFFGALFLLYFYRDFSIWAEVPSVFWKPIWIFKTFHLPVFSSNTIQAMQALWKVALGMSCLGLFTRISTMVSFVLSVYLLGLPHNFGKTDHGDAILVLVLGIMALSRCDAGWSVDRLWRTRRQTNGPSQDSPASGEYTWPVRLVWLVMALVFFAAGMSKLRQSGIAWAMSDNLANWLLQSNYFIGTRSALAPWGLYIAQYGWLCRLLAAATLAFELGYPLALFSRRARGIIVPTVVLIQIGIRILMGPSFRGMLICNLFWVPWDRVSVPVRFLGALALIIFTRPDWMTRLIPFVGSGPPTELLVYLVMAGVALLCVARESARCLGEWTRATALLLKGSRSLTPP